MAYNRETSKVKQDLDSAWRGVLASIKRLHPSTTIRPGSAEEVFQPVSDSTEPKFNIGPFVLNVPERAGDQKSRRRTDQTSPLYIVVKGWITFGGPLGGGDLRTTLHFGTQVGYFRPKGDFFYHVYGVHYDMDETSPSHPVFHAQICTQAGLASMVEDLTKLKFEPEPDWSRGLLRNVRTPTAQMDAFSVITQIGADHLLSQWSGPDDLVAFRKLRAACDFFLGAGGRLGCLNNARATQCYRSTHWYGEVGE